MSSVSSTSSSSSISSYFSNQITGLVSGLDTETMIENCVQSYLTKISSLQQKQTKLQWKQDAYRSITDKLVALSQKYTSYTSSTNLMSPTFFSSAVITEAQGTNAGKVSASNRSDSEIKINSVSSLATAARYAVQPAFTLPGNSTDADGNTVITATADLDLGDDIQVSKLAGSMTITYGTRTVDLSFGDRDLFINEDGTFDADALKEEIESQLSEQRIVTDNGSSYAASDRIKVSVDSSGTISFSDKSTAGNSVYISSISGTLATTTGITAGSGVNSFTIGANDAVETEDLSAYLEGQTATLNINGTSKTFTFGKYASTDELLTDLNKTLGSGITASVEDGKLTFTISEGTTFSMTSDVNEMLGLSAGGTANYLSTNMTLKDMLGSNIGSGLQGTGEITYDEDANAYFDENGNRVADANDLTRIDEDGSVLYGFTINGVEFAFTQDDTLSSVMSRIKNNEDAGVTLSYSKLTGEFVFQTKDTGANQDIEIEGELAEKLFGKKTDPENLVFGETGSAYEDFLLGEDGNPLSFTAEDGKEFYLKYDDANNSGESSFYRCDKYGDLIDSGDPSWGIDENGFLVVTYDYKDITQIDDIDGVSGSDFLSNVLETKAGRKGFTAGTDAELEVDVNGTTIHLTRTSNTVDLDGMSVTLKNTFDAYETDEDGNTTLNPDKVVTFNTTSDSDKIVDAIKSFVEEYNAIMTEVHDAYSTMPLEKNTSTHTKYEPLTDDDKEDMSDSAIEAYEEKAKTGILFADSDLSSLYNRLRSAISTGTVAADLKSIGLSTEYSDGLTTLTLDEDKLREALEDGPDTVGEIFTKATDSGSSTNGLMSVVKNITDAYASTSIVSPGILVKKAGTTLSSMSLLDNTVQDQIDDIDDQISTWQDKMSDKIDYYSDLFTQLEVLMNEMNSQSSALSSLMGTSY